MKKNYTVLGLIMCAAASVVDMSATSAPNALWGKSLDAAGADIGNAIMVSREGDVYTLNCMSSVTTDVEKNAFYYDGQVIGHGASYSSSGANNNLCIVKSDADGNFVWSVYGSEGDIASNQGGLAETSDGGIVAAVKIRHTAYRLTEQITIKDARGNATQLDWVVPEGKSRWYRLLLLKLSKDGAIEWTRLVDVDYTPQPNPSSTYANQTTEAIYVQDVAVDAQDNIYVCGQYRNPVTFTKADKTTETITPHNTEGWNGDPQKSVGDLYLAKFDADGWFEKVFTATGKAVHEKIWQMDISDDNLYVMGVIEGNDTNNEIGYGSINLPLTKESSLLVSKMSMELEPVWARLYPGDAVGGASILQNLNLTVSGNDIWLGGMFNGKLSDDADAANSIATLAKNPREGFVILADATDGHWVKGMTTATSYANKGIAGVFHVFTNVEDDSKFYIFGYDWAKDRGIFIREYEKATFESDPATQNWNIITQGGAMAVSNDLAIQGNKLFTLTRSAKSSNAPVLSGGANADITLATSEGFGVVVGAFEMPFKATSGIEDNLAGVSSVKVFGAEGVLHVVADKAVSVDVYNLLGQRVARVEAEEGDNTVALPAGIYIADKVKVVVR